MRVIHTRNFKQPADTVLCSSYDQTCYIVTIILVLHVFIVQDHLLHGKQLMNSFLKVYLHVVNNCNPIASNHFRS